MLQLTQLLRRAVQINGNGTATMCGERTQSWSSFYGRTVRLASALSRHGFRPGDRIGILALNSDRYLEYFFAIAWGGFVMVPINTRLAAREIAFWLSDSGCTGLCVDETFLPALEQFRPQLPALQKIFLLGDGDAPADLIAYEAAVAEGSDWPDAGRGGDDLAGIFYTGGTTGRSKGVMMTHGNLVAHAMSCAPEFRFDKATNWLHCGPMFHLADGAVTFLLTGVGGTHSFIPRFDPEAFLQAVALYRVTASISLPTMLNMLLNHPDFRRHDISSLRCLLYGASPMPDALIRRAIEAMPHVGFIQGYGQTEAAPVMTMLPRECHTKDGIASGRLRSAGLATLTCEVRIHDEDDNEVERGTRGEICGRGPNVMKGYWNQPELTAVTLRNGWLHTGDLGYMDEDGFLFVVDRLKDMIISGGENVYSAEVEQILYDHSGILECAVFGVPDDKWGERVHAVVRLKPETDLTGDDLALHCRGLLAGYKCPSSFEFRDEPFPLSGAGKILKSELRKPFWAGRESRII